MRNLLVTIAYDGSAYHGWQVQKNAVTVQEVFQNALERLIGERPDVKGCSRTDSGVHARAYCISFKTESSIPCRNIVSGLNTYLPRDIAVLSCSEAGDDFHARYSVLSKQYVYIVHNSRIRDPFLKDRAFHYPVRIDEELLNKEAQAFVGTHDFSGFCSSRSDVEDTVRTVYSFSVARRGSEVAFTVEADGFLYNMVRIMVGTLLFVNEGKIPPGTLAGVIASKERARAGKTAPACGLYLNAVKYPQK